MENIEFKVTDQTGLPGIEALWNKLRLHHLSHSIHFKDRYSKLDFQSRIKPLLEKCNNGKLMIEVAWDKTLSIPAGYCISSIVFPTLPEGEIESLFIEDEYRGRKIGHHFMLNALAWMDENKVHYRKVTVAAGNEEAIPFYEKYGFYAKTIILEQKYL